MLFRSNLAVGTGKIIDLAVSTGKIDNLAVTNAKIANLAVTSGKIDDLAVTTLKIGDQAVTIPVSAFTAGIFESGDATWKTMQQISITSTGAPIYIHFSFSHTVWGTSNNQASEIRLLRDTTVIYGPTAFLSIVAATDSYMAVSAGITDQPGSGDHTYYLQICGGTDRSVATYNRSIVLLEMKK